MKKQNKWLSPVKKWIKRNNVLDIIIFGSFVRGNSHPKDIDLAIVMNERDEANAIDMIDSLAKLLKTVNHRFHITHITEKSLLMGRDTLAKTLVHEGVSITTMNPVSMAWGIKPYSLFLYSLKGFSPSQRVRFHYLLRGRAGEKGVLKSLQGELLGDGVFLIPTANEDTFKEILKLWNVDHSIKRIFS